MTKLALLINISMDWQETILFLRPYLAIVCMKKIYSPGALHLIDIFCEKKKSN